MLSIFYFFKSGDNIRYLHISRLIKLYTLNCAVLCLSIISPKSCKRKAKCNNNTTYEKIKFKHIWHDVKYHFSSVAHSCPTLCDHVNHSTPGLPVHHQLPEFTQTHLHRVSDAIQPSHPLSSPSLLAPNPSQHQSFQIGRAHV